MSSGVRNRHAKGRPSQAERRQREQCRRAGRRPGRQGNHNDDGHATVSRAQCWSFQEDIAVGSY